MNETLYIILSVVQILVGIGMIVGVYVKLNNRVTVVETRLERKVDGEELLKKLDEFRQAIEKKIECEVEKLIPVRRRS